MKKLTRLLALTAAVGFAVTAFAQPAGGPRGGRPGPGGPGGPGGHPILRVIDTDKDRVISAAELATASAAIATLDQNADGVVSTAEFHPARPTPPADAPGRPERPERPAGAPDHPRPIDPVMLALDANADGALSALEISNAITSLKALDANADGQLTPDEVRPLPPVKTED